MLLLFTQNNTISPCLSKLQLVNFGKLHSFDKHGLILTKLILINWFFLRHSVVAASNREGQLMLDNDVHANENQQY